MIPTARLDEKGTVRIGVAADDPYGHGFLGFQLATPFYVNLRQTAHISSLKGPAKNLYPGIDFKLRLWEETARRPAMVLGMDSGFGHKRIASEYFAFSKRLSRFDMTAGIAWGRLGSVGHIKNPLRTIAPHFDRDRDVNSDLPNDARDWFTGEEVGFFGGIEYFTPLKGVSVKADYGANDYRGEKTINGFDAPSPWSVALNYQPAFSFGRPIALSIGMIGAEKIMGRLSIQGRVPDWPTRSWQAHEPMKISSTRENKELTIKRARINLSPYRPAATQLGQAGRKLTHVIPPDQEKLALRLEHKGLKGPEVTLIRHDLERAAIDTTGSPEEIWRDTVIMPDPEKPIQSVETISYGSKNTYRFILQGKLSLSEKDAGPLYRTALLAEGQRLLPLGLNIGASAKLNIKDNLERIRKFRLPAVDPIRSDEDDYTEQRFYIERLYTSWLRSLTGSTHIGLTAGYLEEGFAGYGGEILYRPFGKTFSIGAEGWNVYKRQATSRLGKAFQKEDRWTAHLNLNYEVPSLTFTDDMTAYLKLGRYLAEDYGGTVGLKTCFDNGSALEGYLTLTNKFDANIFGGLTHIFGGVKFSVPLGNIPYVPDGSEIRLITEPFGRDAGRMIDVPLPLYEATEPFSSRQLGRSWKNLLD